jgi:hypothetical protein
MRGAVQAESGLAQVHGTARQALLAAASAVSAEVGSVAVAAGHAAALPPSPELPAALRAVSEALARVAGLSLKRSALLSALLAQPSAAVRR